MLKRYGEKAFEATTGPSSRFRAPLKRQAATLSPVIVKSPSNIAEMRRTRLFAGIAISNDLKAPYIRGRFGRGDVALSDDRKITARHCREIAEKVRQLARQTPIAEIQEELFDLADRLERMGETDPAVGSKRPGKDGLKRDLTAVSLAGSRRVRDVRPSSASCAASRRSTQRKPQ